MISSKTVFLLLAMLLLAGSAAAQIVTGGGGGGGLAFVSSLPATCTPGVTAPVTLSVFPYGVYVCTGTNIWTAQQNPLNVIDVTQAPYNTPLVNFCVNGNVTVTNGSASVSCSTYTFTAADVGKRIFATCCGGNGGLAKITSVLYLGTVGGAVPTISSITNSHTVLTSATASNTCSSTNGCLLFWGNDGTTGLAAAINAAYTASGPCPSIYLPGYVFTSTGQGNTTPTCITTIGFTTDAGLAVFGSSRNGSGIIGTPDFNYATCTGLGVQPSCFFGIRGIDRHDFTIWGGEVGNTGNNAKALVTASVDDFDRNLGIAGWGSADTSLYGYQMEDPGAYPQQPICDGAGVICIVVDNNGGGGGGFNMLNGAFAGDTTGIASGSFPGNVYVKSGAILVSTNGIYGSTNSTNAIVAVDGILISSGDQILPASNNGGFRATSGATMRITGATFNTNGAGNAVVAVSTSKVYVANSSIYGTTCFLTSGAGASINIDPLTACVSGAMGATILPTCSTTGLSQTACTAQAGSTNEKGVLRVTAGGVGGAFTMTLTFAGNFIGATNNPPQCSFYYQNTGSASWSSPTILTTSSASTAAVTIAGTATTVNTSTYDMGYNCTQK